MIYRGRELDAVGLWSEFVSFPPNVEASGFAPLVQCPNPEHHTQKRHFQVNLDQPLVHCFALCGISGTYERAISMIVGCNEREARKIILRHCHVAHSSGSRRKRASGTDRAVRHDRVGNANENLGHALEYASFVPQAGLDYLHRRGIDGNSIARWKLGFDQAERRIVIPARDTRGITRFLIKRSIREQDWPKYLYTEGIDKTSLLFGACEIDRERVRSEGLILVEGSFDTICLHQNSLTNTAAWLGSYLSEAQARIISNLRPKRIYVFPDRDAAGIRALKRAMWLLRKYPCFVMRYPVGGSDPAELTKREAIRAYERAVPWLQFEKAMMTKRSRIGDEDKRKKSAKRPARTFAG
jgi:DNA primase